MPRSDCRSSPGAQTDCRSNFGRALIDCRSSSRQSWLIVDRAEDPSRLIVDRALGGLGMEPRLIVDRTLGATAGLPGLAVAPWPKEKEKIVQWLKTWPPSSKGLVLSTDSFGVGQFKSSAGRVDGTNSADAHAEDA